MSAPASGMLAGCRVLVWGAGTHGGGLAAARYAQAQGAAAVAILDAKPATALPEADAEAARHGWAWHVGDAAHPALHWANVLIISPAVPPRAWPPSFAGQIVCPEALFFAAHQGRRLAITGTKGKSTTAHMAAQLLGWRLGGNSFTPLLDLLATHGPAFDLVCELSSFQLHHLAHGAVPAPRFDAAIVTRLDVDHLDWHPDQDHYLAAKRLLPGWAGFTVADSATAATLGITAQPASERAQRLAAACPLPGVHNQQNAARAIEAALRLGASADTVPARLAAVQALPHRLRTVHRMGALSFVDDSIATNPVAALAALAAISGPVAVILGGSSKGHDFTTLAQGVCQRGALPVLIGQTAPQLAAALAAQGVQASVASSMNGAISAAVAALGPGGGTVLLSPACASFGMFTDYADRGERFTEAAQALYPGQASNGP